MKIKVLKLGESATEITLAEGATVQDAMNVLAEKNDWRWNGHTVMVNGAIAVGWTPLKDSDVLTLSMKIEGGAKIKILKLGESAKEVDIPEGRTIAEAIIASGFSADHCTIMKNGSPASTITPVSEGDVVTLSVKIEGGRL
jgi:sulfur carrier protein ThiS